LDEIMQGELDQVIEPLLREHQIEELAAMGEA
jgi:protein subunit release factor A